MNITFPSDTGDTINAIRNAIGRDVTFLIEHRVTCSACIINPITGTSTDPFCITCSGIGYIITYSGYAINAHITWGHVEQMNWESGGQYHSGDGRIQIEYTSENNNYSADAKYVIVDGKRCIIKNRIFRGVPEINRILMDLEEEEEGE